MSLLPQGLWQTYASYTYGYSYARTAEFIHSPVMQALVWARVPGDVVFGVGALAFVAFMILAFRRPRAATSPASALV
jgi:nitric oxide reductase subunit B